MNGRKPQPGKDKPAEDRTGQEPGKPTTQVFTLTTGQGRVLQYGSRLEADAANQRAGGIGTVSPGQPNRR